MKIRDDWFWQLSWLWAMIAFVGLFLGIQWLVDNHPNIAMYGGAIIVAIGFITILVGEILDSIQE